MVISGNIIDVPKDKHDPIGQNKSAGVVQMVVKINDFCPFSKFEKAEDTLVFNQTTIGTYPKEVTRNLEGVAGLEGVSLRKRYVPLHNFLVGSDGVALDKNLNLNVSGDLNYIPHTTWQQEPSFFDPTENDTECNEFPSFKYSVEELSSEESIKDRETAGGEADELPGRLIQAIHQEKTRGQGCQGIHWRLIKTKLPYYGMDFFIDFFQMSKQRDVDGLKANRPFANDIYDFLDQSRENETKSFLGNRIPINYGVVPMSEDREGNLTKDKESRPLDFSDQAYVIVELGPGGLGADGEGDSSSLHHYFIIITDRSAPILIQEKDGISFIVSSLQDQFKEVISGKTLLSSNFRMTVQNWLGKLVITFETNGRQAAPWIVSKMDIFEEEGKRVERSVIMAVPNGPIRIHGGNIPIAFAFSPLQYQHKYIFNLPPEAGYGGLTTESSDSCLDEAGLVMPNGGEVFATFSATDAEVPDLIVTKVPPGKGVKKNIVDTCDGQIIKDDLGTTYLEFFKKPHYKEPSSVLSGLAIYKKLVCTTTDNRKQKYRVEVTMNSGNHVFEGDSDFGDWTLAACKTPILTIVRIYNDPSEEQRWQPDPHDVSDHVMEFEESWVAQSFWNIEHTGNITFLLNPNPVQNLPETEYIKNLRNKAFYLEAWVQYKDCNYQQLGTGKWKLFTGICFGGTLEYSAGKLVMKCEINDFTKVLEDQRIFNSPFFDGVRDVHAINEILRMAGFRGKGQGVTLTSAPNSPRAFIDGLTTNPQFQDDINIIFPDGRSSYVVNYVLPSGYSRLQSPKFKFADASTLMEAINKIAKTAGKLFFFDQYGLAHYENYLDLVINQISENASSDSLAVTPLANFTSNPEKHKGQSVFNQFSIYWNVADVHNHIRILTSTPDWTPIFADDLEWDSIENPDVQGFLGYLRTFYQEEGAFGDLRAVQNTLQFYRTMFKPPLLVKFETYGLPLRALDIIKFNDQPFRVMRLSSRINPQENVWWQDYECEWFQPADVPDWAFNTQ